MDTMRKLLLIALIILISAGASGCWNYREIDQVAVVSGVAVDMGQNENYKLTIEIIEVSGGAESKTTPRLIVSEGKTVFEAVRNAIAISGKRMYWSHAKVLVISEEVARDGILKILDWYNRDSETRADVKLIISKGISAGEILKFEGTTEEIKSFELSYILENQKSLSKAREADIWEAVNELAAKGMVASVPAVEVKVTNGKKKPAILGTAVFRKDKLIGYLGAEESKNLLFIKDEIKGGVIVVEMATGGKKTPISLEIFKSKTKVKPVVKDNDKIEMNIDIETTVAIDEIQGTEDPMSEEMWKSLEKEAGRVVESDIQNLIAKVQSEYGVDVFGFGARLHENNNKEWKKVADTWEEEFRNLQVNVKSKINIRNSAMLSKPLKVGD